MIYYFIQFCIISLSGEHVLETKIYLINKSVIIQSWTNDLIILIIIIWSF